MENKIFDKVKSTITEIDEENYFLEIFLKFNEKPKESIKKDIFFLIDNSGSMSGERIQNVKKLSIQFVIFMFEIGIKRVNFLIFSDKVDSFSLENDQPEDFIRKKINSIQIAGGTYFSKVLDELSNQIEDKHKNIFVVFLTDGENGDGKDLYRNSVRNLKDKINLKCDSSVFHTLGVSKGHDPLILEEITKLSKNSEGTYQFVCTPEESENAFDNVCELIKRSEQAIYAFLKSKSQKDFLERKILFYNYHPSEFWNGEIILNNKGLSLNLIFFL